MVIKEVYHTIRHGLTDLVHNTLFGKPDVIIMGEVHTDDGHAADQARMIRKYRPEYVLLEGLNGLNPEDTQNLVRRYKMATISELSKYSGIQLEDMGINGNTLQEIRDGIAKEIREIAELYRKECPSCSATELVS